MLLFKCSHDLQQLDAQDPAFLVIQDLIATIITPFDTPENPYSPELYGYIILIEEADVVGMLLLPELTRPLSEVSWEFVEKRGNFYYAAHLVNDELGLAFVIPNADWLPQPLKDLLEKLSAN